MWLSSSAFPARLRPSSPFLHSLKTLSCFLFLLLLLISPPALADTLRFSNNNVMSIPYSASSVFVSSSITVFGLRDAVIPSTLSGNLLVRIRLKITHHDPTDLHLKLCDPTGACATIGDGNGLFCTTYYSDILIDDSQSFQISSHFGDLFATCSPPANKAPQESFQSKFSGHNPNGIWTLMMTDDYKADNGTLNFWELHFVGEDLRFPLLFLLNFFKPNHRIPGYFGLGFPTSPGTVIAGPNPITSVLSVTGVSPTSIPSNSSGVLLVGLKLSLTHPKPSELTLTLCDPSGACAVISSAVGGTCAGIYVGKYLDDVQSFNLGTAGATCTSFPTNMKPKDSFQTTFAGHDPNGQWSLTVSDSTTANNGTLKSWEVYFQGRGFLSQPPPPFSVIEKNTNLSSDFRI